MKLEWKVLIPAVLFVAILTLHYSEHFVHWYMFALKEVKNVVKADDPYNSIQTISAYDDLQEFSKTVKPEDPIYFAFFRREEKPLDYNTTLYRNKGQKKPHNYHLSELLLMLDYLFYPRKVPVIEGPLFYKHTFNPGDYLIADRALSNDDFLLLPPVATITGMFDEFYAVDATHRDSYFIYQFK